MATVARGTRRDRAPIIVYFAFSEAIDIRLLANARDSTDLKRISRAVSLASAVLRFRRENGLASSLENVSVASNSSSAKTLSNTCTCFCEIVLTRRRRVTRVKV